jgi:glutamyl-tRNA synthetase
MRKKQAAKGQLPRYDRRCRSLSKSKIVEGLQRGGWVIRLKVPETGQTKFTDLIRGEIIFENKFVDDQVLLKSDGFPTYQLAVVIDDHSMEISHVIRAEEWISSVPKQILLYQALGWKIPDFAHLPLLRNPDHSKLSKRHNPVWASWYRQQGYLPEAIINYLALMGWAHPDGKEIFDLKEFIEKFDLKKVQTTGPVFDLRKLEWLSGEYIRKSEDNKLKLGLYEFLERKYPPEKIGEIVPLVKDRIKKLSDFLPLTEFLFKKPHLDSSLLLSGKSKEEVEKALALFVFRVEKIKDWKKEDLEKEGRGTADELGVKAADLFMLLRIALTGRTISPPLFETMEVLGREEAMQRLQTALGNIN